MPLRRRRSSRGGSVRNVRGRDTAVASVPRLEVRAPRNPASAENPSCGAGEKFLGVGSRGVVAKSSVGRLWRKIRDIGGLLGPEKTVWRRGGSCAGKGPSHCLEIFCATAMARISREWRPSARGEVFHGAEGSFPRHWRACRSGREVLAACGRRSGGTAASRPEPAHPGMDELRRRRETGGRGVELAARLRSIANA